MKTKTIYFFFKKCIEYIFHDCFENSRENGIEYIFHDCFQNSRENGIGSPNPYIYRCKFFAHLKQYCFFDF